MDKVEGLMLELTASCICEREPDVVSVRELLSDSGVCDRLLKLAKWHDIAHLVGAAAEKYGLDMGRDASVKYRHSMITAVSRCENIEYEYGRIRRVLDDARIPYIPLKGTVIRAMYPEPWMRTSCDIDILVREEVLNRATELLRESLSYTVKPRDTHDISLFSEGNVHLELHYDLIENDTLGKADAPLADIWSYAFAAENGGFCYSLSDDMFYYYHVAHMAKHFTHGGCGVRPFADLWILNHRLTYDRQARERLLEKGGLSAFARAAQALSEVWFSGASPDTLSQVMGDYVIRGGVYGNMGNSAVVKQIKAGGKIKSVMSRIFLPYDLMKRMNPVLDRHPVLLPFCHIKRWIYIITSGRLRRGLKELSANNGVTKEQLEDISGLFGCLGLE